MESKEQSKAEVQIESCRPAEHRYQDERGWVLFPWKGKEPSIDPATLHIVYILPGATRGNHYHPRAAEWICPIEGEGVLKWRLPGGGAVRELHLEAQRICVKIPPGVRHAVTNIGAGGLLILIAREKDQEGDPTVPEKIEQEDRSNESDRF